MRMKRVREWERVSERERERPRKRKKKDFTMLFKMSEKSKIKFIKADSKWS